MNGQILKKYQQKELNLMHITCKKTRNYYFFFGAWETARKLNTQKWVLTHYFRGQNKTENKRISILLLQQITFKKNQKIKAKNSRKTNSKRRNRKCFRRLTKQCRAARERWKLYMYKMTKTRQSFWDKSFFNRLNLVPT